MSDGTQQIIPDDGSGRFGRHVHHDPANRNYPVRGHLFSEEARFRVRTWYRRGVFDQGQTSSCTAQAAAGLLVSSPNRVQLERKNLLAYDAADERMALYREAQKRDPWDGENYEGSSTDAPFKVFRERGEIAEWRWCFGIEDVLRTLSHHGPVAAGTNWHEGMERPNASGKVKVTGAVLGGHAYELVGCHPAYQRVEDPRTDEKSYVSGVNSWSHRWGVGGRFRMSWADLHRLLEADGEAVTIVL